MFMTDDPLCLEIDSVVDGGLDRLLFKSRFLGLSGFLGLSVRKDDRREAMDDLARLSVVDDVGVLTSSVWKVRVTTPLIRHFASYMPSKK
jgi:hypothetical protein